MSKPPRPHFKVSTTGTPLAVAGKLDYLPDEFQDFVNLQQNLAISEGGIVSSGGKGDFTQTLFELSAVLAHILGFYQDRYAREAFLSTAQSSASLVKHGRRLGYEPDPGLAATGYVTFTAAFDDTTGLPLSGTIASGFGLESRAVGIKDPEDYETIEDTLVDAAMNTMNVRPDLTVQPVRPPTPPNPWNQFIVTGTSLGLVSTDVVIVQDDSGGYTVRKVTSAVEDPNEPGTTTVTVDVPLLAYADTVATSAIGPLAGLSFTIDNFQVTDGSTVLLVAQTDPTENGPWVASSGSWVRPFTFATGSHAAGAMFLVVQSYDSGGLPVNTHGNSTWVCLSTPGSDIVDTSALLFPSLVDFVEPTNVSPLAGAPIINSYAPDNVGTTQNPIWVPKIDKTDVPIGSRVLLIGQVAAGGYLVGSNANFTSQLIAGSTLGVSIDGGATVTVTFDGHAEDPASTATEIQAALGKTATVTVVNGQIQIQSNSSGPSSTVNITSANALVGFGSTGMGIPGTDPSQNGIWVTSAGAWTRPADFAKGTHVSGKQYFVLNGATRINTQWICSAPPSADQVDTPTATNPSVNQPLSFTAKTYNNGASLDFSKFQLFAKPASTFYLFGSSTTPQTYPDSALQSGSFVDNQPANERGHALVVATSQVTLPTPDKVLGAAFVAATVNVPTFGETAIDGFALVAGQRILLTNQTNAAQNGLWVVQNAITSPNKINPLEAGAWTRPPDYATGFTGALGCVVNIQAGTYANTSWRCSAVTPDTSSLASQTAGVDEDRTTWTQFPTIDGVVAPVGSRVLLTAQPASGTSGYLLGSGGTFSTHGSLSGSGGTFSSLSGTTLKVSIDGGTAQTVTFDSSAVDAVSTAAEIADQLTNGTAYVVNGQIVIESESFPTHAHVIGQNGTFQNLNGTTLQVAFDSGGTTQTVTFDSQATDANSVASEINKQITGGVAYVVNGQVAIRSNTAGSKSLVNIKHANAAAGFSSTGSSAAGTDSTVSISSGNTAAGFATNATGTNGTTLNGTTLMLSIDGGATQTITFDGTCVDPASTAAFIAANLTGASVSVAGSQILIQSNSSGPGSSVNVVSANAMAGFASTGAGPTGSTNQNGVWVVNAGPWSRPADFASASHSNGAYIFVDSGNTLANSAWVVTGGDIVDTDALVLTRQGVGNAPAIPPTVSYGYIVSQNYSDNDVYLSGETTSQLVGTPLVRVVGSERAAFLVTDQRSLNVTFQSKTRTPSSTILVDAQGRTSSAVIDSFPITAINGFVATLRLQHQPSFQGNGPVEPRTFQDVRNSTWLGDWQVQVPFKSTEPSQALAGGTAILDAYYTNLLPAQYIVLATIDDSYKEIARVSHVLSNPLNPTGTDVNSVALWNQTKKSVVSWSVLDPSDATAQRAWTLGDLKIHGNVAHISHGKSQSQTLGGSDGVTPFLRFALNDKPLTYLPGASNPEPALTITVGGVIWTRVDDFFDSGEHDLHYKLERDEQQNTFVLFGDGIHGAVPPSGTDHIQARYRIGLGTTGNNPAGVVNRIKQASPLLQTAVNARDVSGGADAADAGGILTQATRYIRTFDRAVSVQDHADLALLYPGIARAQARFGVLGGSGAGGISSASSAASAVFGIEGVQVIVATADGSTPQDTEAIKQYLIARRDNAVPLFVDGPTPIDVFLILYFENDPAYLRDAVKANVIASLTSTDATNPGLLSFEARDLGQPLFLSEVYKTVMSVPGVTYVEIQELDTQLNEPGLITLTANSTTVTGSPLLLSNGQLQYTRFTLLRPGQWISVDKNSYFQIATILDDSRLVLTKAPTIGVQDATFVARLVADVIHADPDQWLRLRTTNLTISDSGA